MNEVTLIDLKVARDKWLKVASAAAERAFVAVRREWLEDSDVSLRLSARAARWGFIEQGGIACQYAHDIEMLRGIREQNRDSRIWRFKMEELDGRLTKPIEWGMNESSRGYAGDVFRAPGPRRDINMDDICEALEELRERVGGEVFPDLSSLFDIEDEEIPHDFTEDDALLDPRLLGLFTALEGRTRIRSFERDRLELVCLLLSDPLEMDGPPPGAWAPAMALVLASFSHHEASS